MLSFQELPSLVIDNIAQLRHSNSVTGDYDILLSMSLVCRSWRAAVMRYIFDDYAIKIDSNTLEIPPPSLFPWFKVIYFFVRFPITDCALKHGSDLVFNNINSLHVDIYHSAIGFAFDSYELQQFTTNGSRLINYIRHMVPNVKNIRIRVSCRQSNTIDLDKQYMNMFTQLFGSIVQLANKSLEIQCNPYFNGLDWNTIYNDYSSLQLTNISFHGSSNGNSCELIRRNAEILQFLGFGFSDGDNGFAMLIEGQVTYPNLAKLVIRPGEVYGDDEHVHHRYPNFPDNVVPFPNIQCLKIFGGYLFTDDVLFRGNHHSLRYLWWKLTSHAASFLINHPVFSSGRYKQLEKVSIELINNYSGTYRYECTKVVADIGRYARILEFDEFHKSYSSENGLGNCLALNLGDKLEVIEILDLDTTYLSFTNIIALVSGLSSLRKLGIRKFSGTKFPQRMRVSQMVDRYSPLNTKLKILTIGSVKDRIKEVFRCLAMLATLCPSLERIVTDQHSLKETWKNAMKNKEYKPFQQRLDQIDFKS